MRRSKTNDSISPTIKALILRLCVVLPLLARALPFQPELGPIVAPQSTAWHDRFSIDLVEALGDGPTLHPDPLQQGLPQERGIDRPVSMAVGIRCVSRRVRRAIVVGLVFTLLSMLR